MGKPGPTPAITLDDMLAVFERQESCVPLTAPELAEELGCARRTAHRKLEQLVDRGDIRTKKAGARSRVWWKPLSTQEADRTTSEQFGDFVQAVEDYGIFRLDPQGYVTSWNEGAERIKGYDEEDILGEHFSVFYTEADRRKDVPDRNLEQAVRQGRVEDEGWRVRADGSTFWANVVITAVHDDDGSLEGFTKVTRDLTERKRAEDEHRLHHSIASSLSRSETIEEGLDAVIRSVCRITGWEHGEAWIPSDGRLGRLSATHAGSDAAMSFAEGSMEHGFEPRQGVAGQVWVAGEPDWLTGVSDDHAGFIRDEQVRNAGLGAVLGVPIVSNDEIEAVLLFSTTQSEYVDEWLVQAVESVAADLGEFVSRKRAEESLQREREFLDRILEASPVGIIVFSPDGEIVHTNPRAAENLGVPVDRIFEHLADEHTIFDEDGDPVPLEERPFVRGFEAGESISEWVCQVERTGGGRRWLSINAEPIHGEGGEVERVVTTSDDITQIKEQERLLRRERNQTEELLRTAPVPILIQKRDGTPLMANRRAQEVLNLTEQELIDAPEYAAEWQILDANGQPIDPDNTPSARVRATGEPVAEEEICIEQPDGERKWLSVSASPVFDLDGNLDRIVVGSEDITELKEREHHLEQQRHRLEAEFDEVFTRIDDAFYALDEEWRFTYVNRRAEELLGRSAQELLGETLWEEFPDLTDGALWEHYHEAMETQESLSFEVPFEILDIWVEVNVYPSETGLSVYFEDVTERVERERELERYGTIVETVQDGVYTVDTEGRFTMVNQAYAEMTGYPREELLGEHVSLVVDTETIETARGIEEELAAGERERAKFEADVLTADDGRIRAEASFALLPGRGDDYERVGVVRDVTERMERERELKRFETLIEESTDVNAIVSADGTINYLTPSVEYVLGYSPEELVGENAFDYLHPEDVEETQAALVALDEGAENRATIEFRFKHADGSWLWLESRGRNLQDDPSIEGLVVYTRDVTDRAEYEQELEFRNQQQTVISNLGQYALEAPTLDDLFDEAARRITDVLDTDYCKVLDLDPDAGELLLRQGVGWKDDVVGNATVAADERSQAGYTLKTAGPVIVTDLDTETRFSGPKLLTDHDVVSGISTIIGSRDTPWGILGTHDTRQREFPPGDVQFLQSIANVLAEAIRTRGYQEELEGMVEELEESNERLEQFAYVASHDLQEPLRMISNYLQLLEDRYRDELDDDAEEFINFAVDGAERMREMIDDLLAYSRIDTQAEPFEPTDCDAVVESVLTNLRMQIEETGAEIDVGPLPTVLADRNQLEQVFQNLVSNAIKYSSDDPPLIEIAAERDEGTFVFRIEDNGIGMNPEYTEQIFEVFRRLHTRNEYSGTGIGLALCQKIVERHGGDIWVDSAPGEGSTFYFTIPIDQDNRGSTRTGDVGDR